jgi:two-component system, OmpR family, phosphate regulon response regulator PhoB
MAVSASGSTARDVSMKAQRDRAQILVVEDEPDIAALVAYHLTRAGYAVRTAVDGEEALRIIDADLPDLVVLDLMLPTTSGLDVLKQVRASPEIAHLPVVLLTARREEANRIEGLAMGADDYMTKPFSAEELVLRVGAVLRRVRSAPVQATGRVLRAGALVLDVSALTVSVGDEPVELTPKELMLLNTLMDRRGRVQSRKQLLEAVWEVTVPIDTRTVDMHVQRLRTKLGPEGDRIETVRGFGYRFRAD